MAETHTRQELARLIDHTLLKPEATPLQVEALCAEARGYGFASVCVNPIHVSLCVEKLAGCATDVCSVIGFPLGASTTASKVFEAEQVLVLGATEIDMVMRIGQLKAGDRDRVREDIAAVVAACGQHRAVLKVIIEACLLTDEEKVTACRLAQAAGAHFVKTSTGFAGGGATVADVRLMRETVGPDMGVKAAGGIHGYDEAVAMVEAGASRIGASAGVRIIEGAPR